MTRDTEEINIYLLQFEPFPRAEFYQCVYPRNSTVYTTISLHSWILIKLLPTQHAGNVYLHKNV